MIKKATRHQTRVFFVEEVFDAILKKIKSKKISDFDEIPSEAWKTRQFDNMLLQLCNAVFKQKEKWTKDCIHPFLEKSLITTKV